MFGDFQEKVTIKERSHSKVSEWHKNGQPSTTERIHKNNSNRNIASERSKPQLKGSKLILFYRRQTSSIIVIQSQLHRTIFAAKRFLNPTHQWINTEKRVD